MMPTLTIKGLPEPVHRALKARAAANRRSLNSEIVVALEQAVSEPASDVASRLDRIDAFRATLQVTPLTDDRLAAMKRAGRS